MWIDARGQFDARIIESDDWRCERGLLEGASRFIRAEIVAAASRERLVSAFLAEFPDGVLPWELTREQFDTQPIRRALSNSVYIE